MIFVNIKLFFIDRHCRSIIYSSSFCMASPVFVCRLPDSISDIWLCVVFNYLVKTVIFFACFTIFSSPANISLIAWQLFSNTLCAVLVSAIAVSQFLTLKKLTNCFILISFVVSIPVSMVLSLVSIYVTIWSTMLNSIGELSTLLPLSSMTCLLSVKSLEVYK